MDLIFPSFPLANKARAIFADFSASCFGKARNARKKLDLNIKDNVYFVVLNSSEMDLWRILTYLLLVLAESFNYIGLRTS